MDPFHPLHPTRVSMFSVPNDGRRSVLSEVRRRPPPPPPPARNVLPRNHLRRARRRAVARTCVALLRADPANDAAGTQSHAGGSMFRTHRSIRSHVRSHGARLAAVAGLALVGASSAGAQWGNARYPGNNAQLVFAWEGTVDRETQLNVSRSGVSVRGVSSNESRGRVTSRGTLPRGTGTLYVQRVDGRGSIDVVRQPSANGYGDGVIRIRDPQGGA